MKRRQVNKDDLLKVGLMLAWKHGFYGLSVKQIANEADVLIGSFYNYFKSKEEFYLTLLDYYWIGWEKILKNSLGNTQLNSKERFENFFDEGIERFSSMNFCYACFCGMMTNEMAGMNEKFAVKTEETFNKASKYFELAIEKGVSEGSIHSGNKVELLGNFVLNSFQGALMRMKSAKSSAPLEVCKDNCLDYLFSK